ncbi:ESX secretion-associated protein EspG [Nocardia beijingensis]
MTILTAAATLTVAGALGVQTLPPVLALRPQHIDHAGFLAARTATLAELHADGVLDHDGNVLDDELAAALFVLAKPERQLVLRIRRDGAVRRVCLARRGFDHAVAVRTDDEVDVRTVWGDEDPVALARPLLAALGKCPPADVPVLTAPTAELRRRLDDSGITQASAVYRTGMSESDAITLGMALRQCSAIAELVCYGYRDGSARRARAAAAVYDTAEGRIIAGGRGATDGQDWTTLAPGSDRRFAHVIVALIESLPEGRWMP